MNRTPKDVSVVVMHSVRSEDIIDVLASEDESAESVDEIQDCEIAERIVRSEHRAIRDEHPGFTEVDIVSSKVD